MQIIELYPKLHAQATKSGGRVHGLAPPRAVWDSKWESLI